MDIIEFEIKELKEPTFLEKLAATLKCWQWAAMHHKRFSDCYLGLNQSPVEWHFLENHRFTEICVVIHKRLWFITCIPHSIIDDYQKRYPKINTSLIWK